VASDGDDDDDVAGIAVHRTIVELGSIGRAEDKLDEIGCCIMAEQVKNPPYIVYVRITVLHTMPRSRAASSRHKSVRPAKQHHRQPTCKIPKEKRSLKKRSGRAHHRTVEENIIDVWDNIGKCERQKCRRELRQASRLAEEAGHENLKLLKDEKLAKDKASRELQRRQEELQKDPRMVAHRVCKIQNCMGDYMKLIQFYIKEAKEKMEKVPPPAKQVIGDFIESAKAVLKQRPPSTEAIDHVLDLHNRMTFVIIEGIMRARQTA
jgi:hypothetical protein